MALFDRQKSRSRRVDPRKLHGEGLRGRLIAWTSPSRARRLLVVVVFFVLCLVLMHLPYEPTRYQMKDTTEEPVLSRVKFSYEDARATRQARDEARQKAPNVYVRDMTYTGKIREEFANLISAAAEPAARPPELPKVEPPPAAPAGEETPAPEATVVSEEAKRKAMEAEQKAAAARQAAEEARRQLIESWKLTRDFELLRQVVADPETRKELLARFDTVTEYLNRLPLVMRSDFDRENIEKQRQRIYVFSDNAYEQPIPQDKLLDVSNTSTVAMILRNVGEIFKDTEIPEEIVEPLSRRITDNLQCNLRFDDKLTNEERDAAARKVSPIIREYEKGAELIPAGTVIEADEYDKIQAEHRNYLASVRWYRQLSLVLGSAILVGSVLLLLAVYARSYQHDVAERAIRAFVLAVLYLLVIGIARFAYDWAKMPLVIFPLTTAGMIVAVAYNRRFALVLTWFMILVVGLAAHLTFEQGMLLAVGTAAAILQLDEIRNRSKLIRVGLAAGLVYALVVVAQAMWDRELEWSSDVLGKASLAFAFGMLPGFIILGVLPVIERVFNVVTSISLLELCDVNQAALRKLAIEAPGTYSHSLLLGSIVEPAAEAIGANGLLARVGAYFHDIGKANKPQYFIENRDQTAQGSEHTKLTPQMSKLIITSHIKDGLEMAEQYRLPRAIQPFIAEHHGTTVIEYFYNEARRFGEALGEAPVPDTEFRYPGPKPRSKETGILMLADGCEGAVRSIREPTPAKIEDKVHEIVMKRLLDGQLDDTGMTLTDMRMVEQSLTKSLIGVYHGRIAYPQPTEAKDSRGGETSEAAPLQNGD